jgi:hypothetical protein
LPGDEGVFVGVQWLEHKGNKILYLDCRKLGPPEQVALLEKAAEVLMASPKKVRVLANVEDVYLTSEFMTTMKRLGKEVFALKVEKTAIVGVGGAKSVLLVAYNAATGRDMVSFKTEAKALEWLTK